MNRWKRLIFYLLLNVLVSAITILCVLFVWENTRLKDVLMLAPGSETQSTTNATAQNAMAANLVVEISKVEGTGNLDTEYILLRRIGGTPDQAISLLNWRIRDEDGREINISNHLSLQSLNLHSNGAIFIHSKSGNSDPIDLYLGLEGPLWSPGETVTLLDAEGNIQDTFLIP